ncbi:MAG: type II toxin-antitoxin system VapC family toxin [Fimbriimonadaceae bacterium]|nr:type II toxin-antitoxin system VapC family toxin [Fimbriimonadaceae bacterium]
MPDETDDYAVRVAESMVECLPVVPPHWELEVVNAVVTSVRRKRFGAPEAIGLLEDFALVRLTAEVASTGAPERTAQIAFDFGLTPYDATYLSLAIKRELPVATFDRRMLACAQALGVARYEPAPI